MTQGRYSRIKSRFWTDERSGRWTNDVRLLALYLLTCPHGNMLGCFVLPKPYACADLRWGLDTLEAHFGILLREDFIIYDESVNLILVRKYLKHNVIENPNQVTAAIKVVREIPRSRLLADLAQAVREQAKGFLDPLLEEIGKLLGEPLGEPLGERYGKPVSVSVTVSESVGKDPSSAPTVPTQKGKPDHVFSNDSKELRLAQLLRKRILDNLPGAKVPQGTESGLQRWAKEFDLVLRVDKHPAVEVEQVIEWCQAHSFWRANILSPGKLRKQYDQMILKMRAEQSAKERPGRFETNTERSLRAVKEFLKEKEERE